MANIVIVGGGFGGITAAESLAKKLSGEHQITLVSRDRSFVFYPALVRLAFGKCAPEEIQFDVREAMLDRRIRFIQGEVARIHPDQNLITLAHGDFVGNQEYDYLILALGRRLKTEVVTGFFEHGNHLLGLSAAEEFGKAAKDFHEGQAVIGYCRGARLPVPVFETAFALSNLLKSRGERDNCTIKVVSSEPLDEMFGDVPMSDLLTDALRSHNIDLINNFPIDRISQDSVIASDGRSIHFDLNMIIPPFGGPGAVIGTGLTDDEGYIEVNSTMQVKRADRIYAVGDCVSLPGPKMGHMAVQQAEIVSENVAAHVEHSPAYVHYNHELMLVIDAGGKESTFVQKDMSNDEPATIHSNRFWSWAKHAQERYWKSKHG